MEVNPDQILGNEVIELVEISSFPTPGNGSIPGICRSVWECRLLHGETKEGFIERWKTALKGVDRTDIKIAVYELTSYTGKSMTMEDFLPGWFSAEIDESFIYLVSESVREWGKTVEYYAAPYGCNALISAARRKIPTIILGPGDIDLAHKPNENILIDDLLAAVGIYGTICQNSFRLKSPESEAPTVFSW